MGGGKVVQAARLLLISPSLALIEAELVGREAFATVMHRTHDMEVPDERPPELYDRGVTEGMKRYLMESPDCGCWTMYCIADAPS